MRFPPAEVVSSWPEPNYENPTTRKPYLVPINIILIGTATVMVSLRIYARFVHTRSGGLEDWLLTLALLPAIGLSVTVCLAASRYGWNLHIWDYKPTSSNLIHERAISWASQMLYIWSSCLTKLSFLVFYRNILQTRKMRLITLGCIYFTAIYFIVCFLTLILECRPLSLYWHILLLPKDNGGVCIDEGNPLLTAGVVNVLIDLAILILPIRTVLSLHIDWKQKLHILSIFLVGAFVITCSIIRVYSTWVTIRNTYDVTWDGYLVWMWVGIEVDVGLICASVPACKSLARSWKPKSGSIRRRHNNTCGYGKEVSDYSTVTAINTISFKGRYLVSGALDKGEITTEHVDHPGNETGKSKPMDVSSAQLRTPSPVWSGSWLQDEEHDMESVGIVSIMNRSV